MDTFGSQLKTGIILNYLNIAISSLIPIFYTPVMLSLLGQNEYGLYKLSGSVTSYLSLMALGLGAAITRYLIKARIEEGQEAEEKILGLFVAIFTVISLLTVLVGGVLAINVESWFSASLSVEDLLKMKILVFILACNTAVNFLTAPYISVVNAHEKFIFFQNMGIFATCMTPFLNLVALYMGYASVGLAVTSLGVMIAYRIIYSLYVKYKMGITIRFSKPSCALIKEIFSFSFWIFISNIVGQLYGVTDTIMIGYMPALATVGVAIYSIGETFTSIIGTLNSGISSLLIPKANKMVFSNASNEKLTDTAIQMGRIQSLIISLFVFGFISFGRPFIYFYAGEEYVNAYWVAIICMIPGAIPMIQSFCLNILIAKNKNKFRALVYLFIAIFNVMGTWFMIQVWGIIGAAAMTAIAMFIGNGIVMNWYYKERMGINIIGFWKNVGKILIVPGVLWILTLCMSKIIDFYIIWNLLIGIFLFTLLYSVFNWIYVMNADEKSILRNIILSLKRVVLCQK